MTIGFVDNLLAYSCGLTLMVLCAWTVSVSVQTKAPRLLLAYFQVTLIVATVLPLLSLLRPATVASAALLPVSVVAGDAVTGAAPSWLPVTLAATVLFGATLRLALIAIGCVRLRHCRRAATPLVTLPAAIVNAQEQLQVRARWFVTRELASAATYGIRNPIVLLPAPELERNPAVLQFVARHELLHISRRDWLMVLAEELVLAGLWFEPALWFLIDRIRLHREQVVDRAVIAGTNDAHNYANALLAGAGADWTLSPRPASHWRRARHLRWRLQAIVNGGIMSRSSQLKWSGAFAVTLLLAGYSAVHAFPLQNASAAQTDQHVYSATDPGVTLPRIVREVKPQYTQEAMDAHIEGQVTLAVVVDAKGTVAQVQITESLDPTYGLDKQAVAAAWQWQFSPATKDGKPVAIAITIVLKFTLK